MISILFDKGRSTITEHLINIFKEGELEENSVCREFRHTGIDGKEYNTKFYNLDAIISVGYRVNSIRATQFRQWATVVLRENEIKTLDRFITMYLDYAETQAQRKIPMTMEDWGKGDLVIEISGGSPTQSTGRITYINESMLIKYDKDFICTNFCRTVTLKENWNMEYENGTTGIKNLDINSFMDTFTIAKPNRKLILKFNSIVSVLLENIQFSGGENDKLSKPRDTFFPKLMSGELRVPLKGDDI